MFYFANKMKLDLAMKRSLALGRVDTLIKHEKNARKTSIWIDCLIERTELKCVLDMMLLTRHLLTAYHTGNRLFA